MTAVESRPSRGRLLVALSAASYLTSFLRERFLLQQAFGSLGLDRAVGVYAIASVVGNLYAVGLGLAWIDGRRIPRWATAFAAYAAIGGVAAFLHPTVGGAIVLASLTSAYEYNRQRAVYRARQPIVFIAAVLAPAATIGVWQTHGVGSLPAIIAGYAAGYMVQGGAAWLAARGASPNPLAARTEHVPIAWAAAWAGLTQLNGYLDRLLFLAVGRGWAGAGAFGLGLAQAAMLIVAGPLASEAVAGRARNQPTRRFVAGGLFVTIAGFAAIPVVLPVLVAGGAVHGAGYHQVRDLTLVYAASIPVAGYWSFRARALQTGSHMWRPMAIVVTAMFVVHLVVSVIAALTNHPLWIGAGFVVSSAFGAALVSRDWRRSASSPPVRIGPFMRLLGAISPSGTE